MATKRSLPVLKNLATARFECVFPRCGGPCCHDSRPNVSEGEAKRITRAVPRVLPKMRPAARKSVEKNGWLTKRIKAGLPTIAVAEKQCVFYNDGCVLHALGATEGDTTKYKPSTCVLFPIDAARGGDWEVRQWGQKGETWKLFCLDPAASPKLAKDTLRTEIDFLERLENGRERWRE